MATVAVPQYLAKLGPGFYEAAPPGHRLSLYLRVWGENQETGQVDWRTMDRVPKLDNKTGQPKLKNGRPEFEDVPNDLFAFQIAGGAVPSQKHSDVAPQNLPTRDDGLKPWKPLVENLTKRQATFAAALEDTGQLLRVEAKSIAPFSTGLGNEHPLENGFAFLNPYGLPYLAGSGVKGVLRQAARELRDGFNGVANQDGWTDDAIRALFGVEDGDGDPRRGALSFWDVIPQLAGDSLKVEVMTPHQTHYYQNGASPHESGSPNPINFLAVPPGSGFAFHVQCDRPFLARLAPELAEGNRWQTLMRTALEHAFEWLGFGAKTAVGYGAMQIDKKAEDQREYQRQQREADALKRAAETERTEALSRLSPVDRKIEQAKAAKQPGQSDDSAVFNALKANQFDATEISEAAQKLKAMMLAAKSWKETTSAKKPEKDKEYQRTLDVMKWLKG